MAKLVPDIIIQKRDVEFLQLLLHSRILTRKHVAILLYDGNKENVKKRVQKLKANGLVLERRRKVYEQGVLFLSKRGFECLREHGALPAECSDIPSFSKRGQVSELTLRHELEVLDVKAAFYEAVAKRENLSIAEFSTWPKLYEFSVTDQDGKYGGKKKVKPDGFIRLHEKEADGSMWEHIYFLEVDRSTEKLNTLIERIRHYNLFYRSGGMAERFGRLAEAYKEFPFRILVVCKSYDRQSNIGTLLLKMDSPIFTQVCLSTFAKVYQNPLGSIWLLPEDYSGLKKGIGLLSQNFVDSRNCREKHLLELDIQQS